MKNDLPWLLVWMPSSQHLVHRVCNTASKTLCRTLRAFYQAMCHLLARWGSRPDWSLLRCCPGWRRSFPFWIDRSAMPMISPLLGIWPFCLIWLIRVPHPSFCRLLSKHWGPRGKNCDSPLRHTTHPLALRFRYWSYSLFWELGSCLPAAVIVGLYVAFRAHGDLGAPRTDGLSQV